MGLTAQNRPMLSAVSIISKTACERIYATLSIALFAACAANLALVCAFL